MTSEARPVGVVLAAGMSSRFGRSKALIEIDGEPLIVRLIRTYAESCSPIIVITGHDAAAVAGLAGQAGARIVHNPRFAEGVFTSLAVAAETVDVAHGDRVHVLLSPVDLPLSDPRVPRRMLGRAEASGAALVIPTYGGRFGYPLLFRREALSLYATESGKLRADEKEMQQALFRLIRGGARRFGMSRERVRWLETAPVPVRDVVFNFNDPSEVDRWLAARNKAPWRHFLWRWAPFTRPWLAPRS